MTSTPLSAAIRAAIFLSSFSVKIPHSQSFLDELMARSDIVDVVGSYVQLTRKGANLFGLCPFHSEKTGSFSVSRSVSGRSNRAAQSSMDISRLLSAASTLFYHFTQAAAVCKPTGQKLFEKIQQKKRKSQKNGVYLKCLVLGTPSLSGMTLGKSGNTHRKEETLTCPFPRAFWTS